MLTTWYFNLKTTTKVICNYVSSEKINCFHLIFRGEGPSTNRTCLSAICFEVTKTFTSCNYMLTYSNKAASKVIQGCFMGVLRVLNGCLKGV